MLSISMVSWPLSIDFSFLFSLFHSFDKMKAMMMEEDFFFFHIPFFLWIGKNSSSIRFNDLKSFTGTKRQKKIHFCGLVHPKIERIDVYKKIRILFSSSSCFLFSGIISNQTRKKENHKSKLSLIIIIINISIIVI